jgi:hypothetical protein
MSSSRDTPPPTEPRRDSGDDSGRASDAANISGSRDRGDDGEIEDAQFVEAPVSDTSIARSSRSPLDDLGGRRSDLSFAPQVHRPSRDSLLIRVARDDRRKIPWGFWAAAALALFATAWIALTEAGLYSIWDFLLASMLAVGVTLVVRFGRRHFTSLSHQTIARVDLERGELWLTTDDGAEDDTEESPSSGSEIVVGLDEITEVVFAMIYFPISRRRSDARVRAYTLMVRDGRGELVPLLEACADKEETFALAQMIARLARAPLSQVGAGVRDDPSLRR